MSEIFQISLTPNLLSCLIHLFQRKRLAGTEGPNSTLFLQRDNPAKRSNYNFILITFQTQPIPRLKLKIVAQRFGKDDPSRTIDGSFDLHKWHFIMVNTILK